MVRCVAAVLAAAGLMLACAGVAAPSAPRADHHQHVFSPALGALVLRGAAPNGLTADELVALLDAAGIERAVLLSVGYLWGSPSRSFEDEYQRVRAENDWSGQQAAQHPGRLRAFCGFNPLKDYALRELARCAADPRFARGIKLHLGNSDVQLDHPAHLAQMKELFRAANAHRMTIVVHLRASISRQRPYGAAQARIFLEELLPLVPDVHVQVAHLAGTGPGYEDSAAHQAMDVLADAVRRGDPRTRNLWFDVAGIATADMPPASAQQMASRLRQLGVDRVLFGSDAAVGGNLRPAQAWAALRRLPLTQSEFARIAANVPPWLR